MKKYPLFLIIRTDRMILGAFAATRQILILLYYSTNKDISSKINRHAPQIDLWPRMRGKSHVRFCNSDENSDGITDYDYRRVRVQLIQLRLNQRQWREGNFWRLYLQGLLFCVFLPQQNARDYILIYQKQKKNQQRVIKLSLPSGIKFG